MGAEKLHALIAEDDPEALHMVSEALGELGADVSCAVNGDELIARLAETPYDLIVTDVSMPWMTGLQAVHSARTAGLATPIVVITAVRSGEIERQVSALGRDAALVYKPFGLDELYAAIEGVLHARPAATAPASSKATSPTASSVTPVGR